MGEVWCKILGMTQKSGSTLCPIFSVGPSKRLFTKQLLFHLHVNCLPLLKSQTCSPNILFCLQLNMVFDVRALVVLVRFSVSLGNSHVYMLLKFGVIFSQSSVLYQFNCQISQKVLGGKKNKSSSQTVDISISPLQGETLRDYANWLSPEQLVKSEFEPRQSGRTSLPHVVVLPLGSTPQRMVGYFHKMEKQHLEGILCHLKPLN